MVRKFRALDIQIREKRGRQFAQGYGVTVRIPRDERANIDGDVIDLMIAMLGISLEDWDNA
jgi:hypothetical protein